MLGRCCFCGTNTPTDSDQRSWMAMVEEIPIDSLKTGSKRQLLICDKCMPELKRSMNQMAEKGNTKLFQGTKCCWCKNIDHLHDCLDCFRSMCDDHAHWTEHTYSYRCPDCEFRVRVHAYYPDYDSIPPTPTVAESKGKMSENHFDRSS